MHTLKRIRDDEFTVPCWIENFGDYNRLPEPAVPCSIEEFWRHMAVYNPVYIDFRQVYSEGKDHRLFNTQLFFFYNRAFAVIVLSDGSTQVFRIGCSHSWIELDEETCRKRGIPHEGMCYHVYECPSCKTIRIEDSSD